MSEASVLLSSLSDSDYESYVSASPVHDYLLIDAEGRITNIPETEVLLGVETDQDVERKYFRCPRYVGDNIDLSKLQLIIKFQNAEGNKDKYIVNDVTVVGQYIEFSWKLSAKVLAATGVVMFAIQAVSVEADGTVNNRWNTTLASGNVLETLIVDDLYEIEEEQARDVLTQLLQLLDDKSAESIQSIQTETDAQIQRVQAAGNEVLASIPDEYQSTVKMANEGLRTKADAIVQTVQGESIKVTDSSDDLIRKMTVAGRTLVNLAPPTNNNFISNYMLNNGTPLNTDMFKPNTVYTVFLNDGSSKIKSINICTSNADYTLSGRLNINGSVIFTTPTDIQRDVDYRIYYYSDTANNPFVDGDQSKVTCIILEGEYTNKTFDYFEGLKSLGETNANVVEIRSHGKNLYDTSKNIVTGGCIKLYDNGFRLEYVDNNNRISGRIPVHLRKNKTYTISFKTGNYRSANDAVHVEMTSADGVTAKYRTVALGINELTITPETDLDHIAFYFHNTINTVGDYVELYDIQVEENSAATDYEPYKESIATIVLDEPIRSLPNGVHDELIVEDGKVSVIRKVGRVVYDGSSDEGWWRNVVTDSKENTFVASKSSPPDIDKTLGVTDGYAMYILTDMVVNKSDTNIPSIYTTDSSIVLTISNKHTPNDTIAEFNNYLASNNITMLYQLAVPTITEISIDSAKNLHTHYPNTNIIVDAGVIYSEKMLVNYNADTKIYIDNRIRALIGEILQEA